MKTIIIFATIHIISMISMFIIYTVSGVFKNATEHGDDIRFASFCDLIILCIVVPEVLLVERIVDFIGLKLNALGKKLFKK